MAFQYRVRRLFGLIRQHWYVDYYITLQYLDYASPGPLVYPFRCTVCQIGNIQFLVYFRAGITMPLLKVKSIPWRDRVSPSLDDCDNQGSIKHDQKDSSIDYQQVNVHMRRVFKLLMLVGVYYNPRRTVKSRVLIFILKVYSGTLLILSTADIIRLCMGFKRGEVIDAQFGRKIGIVCLHALYTSVIILKILDSKHIDRFLEILKSLRHRDTVTVNSYIKQVKTIVIGTICYTLGWGIGTSLAVYFITFRSKNAHVIRDLALPFLPDSPWYTPTLLVEGVLSFFMFATVSAAVGHFVCIVFITYKEFHLFNASFQKHKNPNGRFNGDLEEFRLWHESICHLCEIADDILAPFLGFLVAGSLCLFCFALYALAHGSSEPGDIGILLTAGCWCLSKMLPATFAGATLNVEVCTTLFHI